MPPLLDTGTGPDLWQCYEWHAALLVHCAHETHIVVSYLGLAVGSSKSRLTFQLLQLGVQVLAECLDRAMDDICCLLVLCV